MKSKLLFAMAFCGLIMFSCSEKDDDKLIITQEGEATEVTLQVKTVPGTRAETVQGTEKESAVSVVEFYVFDDQGAPDPKVGDAANPGYVRVESGNLTQKLIVTSGKEKKFVTVLNMNLGGLGTSGTYATLKSKMAASEFKASAGLNDHNSRVETAGKFEMSGETKATIDPEEKDVLVRISVDRVVSKINAPIYKNGNNPTGVTLNEDQIKDLWGDNSGIDPDDITFKPLGYAVVNGLSKSDAFFISNSTLDPEDFPWSNWRDAGKTHLISTFDVDGFYVNNYSSGQGATADHFLAGTDGNNTHRVYVFENKPEEGEVDGQWGYDPKTVYSIMIKGDLEVSGQPAMTKTRYWRIPLTLDDDFHIIRNSVYDVYLQNIITIGYENPEDAEKPIVVPKGDASADVRIVINEWALRTYPTDV